MKAKLYGAVAPLLEHFLVCTLLLPSIVMAAADLTGRVELDSGVITPGTRGRAVLTIINNGPDRSAPVSSGSSFPGTVGFRTFGILGGVDTPPCVVRYTDFVPPPPQVTTIAASIVTLRELDPGDSISCVIYIETYPESPSSQRVRFGFGPTVNDPVPTNNEVFVTLRTGAELVALPTFVSFGLGLLLSLMVAIGLLRLHKPWGAR
jgi:hypothetical protein